MIENQFCDPNQLQYHHRQSIVNQSHEVSLLKSTKNYGHVEELDRVDSLLNINQLFQPFLGHTCEHTHFIF